MVFHAEYNSLSLVTINGFFFFLRNLFILPFNPSKFLVPHIFSLSLHYLLLEDFLHFFPPLNLNPTKFLFQKSDQLILEYLSHVNNHVNILQYTFKLPLLSWWALHLIVLCQGAVPYFLSSPPPPTPPFALFFLSKDICRWISNQLLAESVCLTVWSWSEPVWLCLSCSAACAV